MSAADRERAGVALDWVRRLHDPSFDDWEAHLAWLEADVRNTDAFDVASVLMEDASKGLSAAGRWPQPVASNDNPAYPDRQPARWPRWAIGMGGALAAGLAIVLALPSIAPGGPDIYEVRTAAAARRDIVLAGGTRIALNGATVIALDRTDPRKATLVRGEAYFDVAHDAAHPFVVRLGNSEFQDVGTAFNAVRGGDGERVSVREGAVLYDPSGAAVRLDRGKEIAVAGGKATVAPVDATAVGGWRAGRLAYREAHFGTIAEDLSRTTGTPIHMDPRLADRTFSGVILTDRDQDRLFRRAASVMGIEIRKVGTGWKMAPRIP